MSTEDFHPNPYVKLLNTSWPLFRAFRVNVRVSWTILIIPLLFALEFGRWMPFGQAIAWGAAWTLALYTTVWTHEMGHITMGRRLGIETERMTLRALGGLAHLTERAQTPLDDIKISLAGPAVHLVWMAVLYPLKWALADAYSAEMWFWFLSGLADMQWWLMVFNLLPVYPTDGGNTLRGLLSLRMHSSRASYYTANIGFAGNGLFIAAGVLSMVNVDPFGWGRAGFLTIWLGIWGIQQCRRLRLEAMYGEAYGDHDPFQKTLLASQAALRSADQDERKERDVRRSKQEERRRLQETADRLLDRINEVGGVANLTAAERKELERASKALAEDS